MQAKQTPFDFYLLERIAEARLSAALASRLPEPVHLLALWAFWFDAGASSTRFQVKAERAERAALGTGQPYNRQLP